MKYSIIFILITLHYSFTAQTLPDRPYEKIFFSEITPDWYTVNYDSEMDNDRFDGYNNFVKLEGFEPLIHGNGIYEIYYQQNTNEPTGTYIQKRDIKDGTLLWRKYIGYPQDNQQILGRNLLINIDGNLEVIFQVKCDPYDPHFPLLGRTNMALYKITFDISNGNIINKIDYRCNDSTYLQTNFDLFYLNSVSNFFGINNKFYFTQGEWVGANWQYVIFEVEDNFRKDAIYSKGFPKKYICYGDLPIFFNDSTKIVFNSNCKTKSIEMTFIDNEFNPIKTVISDSLSSKLNELRIKKFDPINRRFLLENVINFDSQEIELLIINENGKLLKRILIPAVYNRSYGLLEWNNVDSLIFLASRTNYKNNIPFVTMDVLRSNSDGKVNVSKSFGATDSLRYTAYSTLIGSDNEYYFLEFNESSLKKSGSGYSLDRSASAFSMMKIKKSLILNPVTSTIDIAKNKLKCYPNPTSGNLIIEGLSSPAALTVSNINGQIIKAINNVKDNVYIDNIPNGIYIFEFKNHKISERHKIVKME